MKKHLFNKLHRKAISMSIFNLNKLILMKIKILVLTFFCYSQINAQINLNQGASFKDIFYDSIPFEFIRGKIIVPVTINNKIRKFIFDTGAPLIIYEEIKNELDLEELYEVPMLDAVGGNTNNKVVKLKSLKIKNISFDSVQAIIIKQHNFYSCLNVSGIIGSNILRNCIVQIDLKNNKLILTNDITKLDTNKSSVQDLYLDEAQSNPYIEISLGKDISFWANFDSGDESSIYINKEEAQKAIDNKVASVISQGFGKIITSLTENQQNQPLQLFQFDTIVIVTNRFISFQTIPFEEDIKNRVGIGLGKYGVITIDYLNKKFYFKPHLNDNISQLEKPISNLGCNIFPSKNNYTIGTVWSNTPADRLGLKSGFKILMINEIDFSKRTPENDCKLFLENYTMRESLSIKYIDDNNVIKAAILKVE